MKKTLTKLTPLFSLLFIFTLIALPYAVSADLQFEFKNPLAFSTIEDFLVAILNVVIVIATPIVVLFIIYAGFLYVTARGNATQVEEATRALTYAIIGGVLIIGAVAISKIIANLVGSFAAP